MLLKEVDQDISTLCTTEALRYSFFFVLLNEIWTIILAQIFKEV